MARPAEAQPTQASGGAASPAPLSASAQAAIAALQSSRSGTQSFLGIIDDCRRRPSLLAIELAWRWAAGLPTLLVIFYQLRRIAVAAAPQLRPLADLSLESLTADPENAGLLLHAAWATVQPALVHAAVGLGPAIVFAWALCAGFGRMAVLRRYDSRLPDRPWTLAFFNLAATVTLLAMIFVWFTALGRSADFALGHGEPNLILYAALVICISLGMFFLRSLVSWILLAAPLIALADGVSGAEAIARSLRLRSLRGKLVEVNLVMGIIRLALVVLATVFSAIPLPFTADMQGPPLYAWWVFVTLLYLAASDFFQLARGIAFLQFRRAGSTAEAAEIAGAGPR